MVFFHKAREGRVVLTPSTFEFIKEVGVEGQRRIPKWGKTVSFQGIPDYRYKGKTWRGTQDVKDGQLCSMLMTHPAYGTDFIAFSDEGGEAQLVDSFFEHRDNGTVYCWLTDRSFVNAQGAAGHKESSAFKKAVEAYLNQGRSLSNT